MNTNRRKKKELWFPSIFNDFFSPDWFGGTINHMSFKEDFPATNIKENDRDFSIELAVPGKKKEDFNIEMEQGILTISSEAKKASETKNEEEHYTHREFGSFSFKRTYSLPETINAEGINATYKDGILRVCLPKKEISPLNRKKTINIS